MTRRRLKVLVAYSMSSTFATTTLEYLSALKRYTDFDVSYVHATHDAEMDFDFGAFDVVFQNYCVRLCFEGYVSHSYQQALRGFKGLKVLAVQDDYDRTWTLHRAIRDLGFHVLLTCIQRDFWPVVYPASEVPGVHIVQGLTGYMPETLIELGFSSPPLSERRTVVGYRGRDIGAKYGRLGFDKYEIGRRMIEICAARGIAHDIAMDDASRIYGDAWYEFLGSCRVVLGSESASNVFDFDGSIEKKHDELREQLGRAPTYEEFRPYTDHVESQFNVGQISPRVFECAVMRTPMVLFRGRYSDAIEPDVHYISLEKGFSNVDDVLRRIEDIQGLEAIADRAYERLVSSGQYGYKAFAAKMKAEIEEQYELLLARKAPDIRPEVELAAVGDGVDPAELPIRHIVLAERPTAKPKSLKDFHRKQVRVALEYYVEKFPELQSFYSSTVAACTEEANRMAADYFTAAELRARVVARADRIPVLPPASAALTELMLSRREVEEELTSVASQIDTLRQLRKEARLTGDDTAVETTLDRELEIHKHYFELGPQLYQKFSDLYQRACSELIGSAHALRSASFQRKPVTVALEYYVEKFPELQSFYSSAVAACTEEATRLAADYITAAELRARLVATADGNLVRARESAALTELMLSRREVEEELTSVASQIDTLRQLRKEARLTGDDTAVETTLERELKVLQDYFELGPQLYQKFSDLYQRTRDELIEGARALRGNPTAHVSRAKGVITRMPGVRLALRLRRRILRSLG